MYFRQFVRLRFQCCILLIPWIVSTVNPQVETNTFYSLLDNKQVFDYIDNNEDNFYKFTSSIFGQKFHSEFKKVFTLCNRRAVIVSLREILALIRYNDDASYMSVPAGAVVTDCLIACEMASKFFPALGVAVVSSGCSAANQNDIGVDDTIVRMKASWRSLAKPLLFFLNKFEWKTIAIIRSNKAGLKLAAQSVGNFLLSNHIKLDFFDVDRAIDAETYRLVMDSKMTSVLTAARETSNILVVFLTEEDYLVFLKVARTLQMLNGHYAIITPNDIQTKIPNESLETAKKLQEGLILMNYWLNKTEGKKASSSEVGFFVDATIALFEGMRTTPQQNSSHITLMEAIRKVHFDGVTGGVAFKENGERKLAYAFNNVRNGQAKEVLYYMEDEDEATINALWSSQGIVWPGGSSVAPNDTNPNDSRGSIKMNAGHIIMAFVMGNCATLLIIYFIYRLLRYRSLLKSTEAWIIPWAELSLQYTATVKNRSQISVSPSSHAPSHGSSESKVSSVDFSRTDDTHFVATYKNGDVIVERLNCASIDLTKRSILNEVYQTMGLSHENIVRYVGLCPYQPNVAIVMTIAKRGTLQDLIMSSDRGIFTLDFMASLLLDAAKGMAYLHSTDIGSHGYLTSAKCVVDSKWTCQISGCGFRRLKKTKKRLRQDSEHEELYYRGLLWTAPELLRIPENKRPIYGTKEGDVYSFAIILQEVVLTKPPYSEEAQQYYYRDIVALIQKSSPTPFRPALVDAECSSAWIDLIKRCWNETPNKRPTFHKIIQDLEGLSETQEQASADLMEKLMLRTEKHAMNLAEQVKQATADLELEQKKAQTLLHALLPRFVAERLENGKKIEPESFESCTMYYADIIGFTKIASLSSPMQVVQLLNSLYSKYDEITDSHDTYKVETIGDCYVVASGLPVRNGNQHAVEIANLALDMLAFVKSFTIPHMKNQTLETRIGIHSGPVLAGIVGTKTSRYTVFGETAAIAERMEALGEANKIHITMMTVKILKETNLYIFEERGKMEVTRGNILTTYFLLGRKDPVVAVDATPSLQGSANKAKASASGLLLSLPNLGVTIRSHSNRESATNTRHGLRESTAKEERNLETNSVKAGVAKISDQSSTNSKVNKKATDETKSKTDKRPSVTDRRLTTDSGLSAPQTDRRVTVINEEKPRQSGHQPSLTDQELKATTSARRHSDINRTNKKRNSSRPSLES